MTLHCTPQGSLDPWGDARPRTCTLCAEYVTMRARPDGDGWYGVDATGSPAGTRGFPDLCACIPPDSGWRTRTGRIVERLGEIDEKPRHYGAGLPAAAWFGALHTHDTNGGEVRSTALSPLPLACGHRLPPTARTAPIEPLAPTLRPPECHGQPMRWTPRGWCCRIAGRYFPPRVDTASRFV